EPAPRHRRALPRAQVEPELLDPPEPAGGDREPHRRRAHALQRGGARLQHGAQALPREHGGVVPRLPREGVLRGRPRQPDRSEGPVLASLSLQRLGVAGLRLLLAVAGLGLLGIAATVALARLPVPPAPTRRLNDYAGALTPTERDRLEARLATRPPPTPAPAAL